jgi:pyruvate/2-oxoglutarate/acetoin dehydrogenase E1 component
LRSHQERKAFARSSFSFAALRGEDSILESVEKTARLVVADEQTVQNEKRAASNWYLLISDATLHTS